MISTNHLAEIHVCHITSAHDAHDDRIFLKECLSLAREGYRTTLVAYGKSELANGVEIVGLGDPPLSRRKRMFSGSRNVAKCAIGLKADLYHIHDPELLRFARKLKKTGAKVVFDSHEDVPAQILDKTWIPSIFRKIISNVFRLYERQIIRSLDAVVAATPYIGSTLEGKSPSVVVVNNYPILSDIRRGDRPFEDRQRMACYIGGINELRGEVSMVEAAIGGDYCLCLAGNENESSFSASERRDFERSGVKYLGYLTREEINEVLGESIAGLVCLLPAHNYINSQPIKMYEYMAAGIPVIASDFPLWRSQIERNNCGLLVNPCKPNEIRLAVETLVDNRALAARLGENGYQAAVNHYNWNAEADKLFALYAALLEVCRCSSSERK